MTSEPTFQSGEFGPIGARAHAFLTITARFFGFSIGTIATWILFGLLPVVGGTLALVSMRKIGD